MELINNTLDIYWDASFWLLLGFLMAGIIKVFVPDNAINRWLGGKGFKPIIKAAFIGAPLPLCSCGVIPAAIGLKRAGASRPATISFLVATPETGVDSVAISYALLGPFMTIVRPVAAVVSAIFTGFVTRCWLDKKSSTIPLQVSIPLQTDCGCQSSCCNENTGVVLEHNKKKNIYDKLKQGFNYAMTDILKDVAIWLMLGILVAGIMVTLIPPDFLKQWGSGLGAMVIMLIVSVPMYICATASTPLGAAMIMSGVSPGTVLVFLLAGPATNISTLIIIFREMGQKTLIAYITGIVVASLSLGLLVDAMIEMFQINIQAQISQTDHLIPVELEIIAGLLLAVAMMRLLWQKYLSA